MEKSWEMLKSHWVSHTFQQRHNNLVLHNLNDERLNRLHELSPGMVALMRQNFLFHAKRLATTFETLKKWRAEIEALEIILRGPNVAYGPAPPTEEVAAEVLAQPVLSPPSEVLAELIEEAQREASTEPPHEVPEATLVKQEPGAEAARFHLTHRSYALVCEWQKQGHSWTEIADMVGKKFNRIVGGEELARRYETRTRRLAATPVKEASPRLVHKRKLDEAIEAGRTRLAAMAAEAKRRRTE